MGISEEIEDTKITAGKTKISRLKQRSKIDQNLRDQIKHSELLRYKIVKTHKHYRKYVEFLNCDI